MTFLVAHWRILSGLAVGVALAGYVGVLHVQLTSSRATAEMLNRDLATALTSYSTCAANLRNVKERIKSDATVPDDLDGFLADPGWMLDAPGPRGPAH